jgi:hypothetical protein
MLLKMMLRLRWSHGESALLTRAPAVAASDSSDIRLYRIVARDKRAAPSFEEQGVGVFGSLLYNFHK